MMSLKLGLGMLLGSALALSAVACSGDAGEPTDRSKTTTQKSSSDDTDPSTTPASAADGGAAPTPSPAPKPGGC